MRMKNFELNLISMQILLVIYLFWFFFLFRVVYCICIRCSMPVEYDTIYVIELLFIAILSMRLLNGIYA